MGVFSGLIHSNRTNSKHHKNIWLKGAHAASYMKVIQDPHHLESNPLPRHSPCAVVISSPAGAHFQVWLGSPDVIIIRLFRILLRRTAVLRYKVV
jgi:hypothetical protein